MTQANSYNHVKRVYVLSRQCLSKRIHACTEAGGKLLKISSVDNAITEVVRSLRRGVFESYETVSEIRFCSVIKKFSKDFFFRSLRLSKIEGRER